MVSEEERKRGATQLDPLGFEKVEELEADGHQQLLVDAEAQVGVFYAASAVASED